MKAKDVLDDAVRFIWFVLFLAIGYMSLLAMLPFMVIGRMVRKGRPWI